MAEEQKKDNTYIIIVAVCAFLAIGLVTILKSRETEHLNYQDNTTVQQEAQLFEGIKKYDNNFE
ncbi:hypothetical protein [methanotrophic endosymbiont of Bathymodiolus puteoserpentis (Logatchev)]|jgi:large-conductance mechanosensitive channel|uniref:hypothetical protein n=1 Tax=methanotrophic endosymbiont of Bathymodiolus puteoserpentis (Logatchev) TaxID=343235 RepID=UPI0013C5E69E|nr:hypothetical protein [methanotrophic endosymbiont of Bathymodiolus puteoserpentis (Logatchev)]SHE19278.1 hypothetical protein BPUTEOMOX_195 [methanotrophic endosymbiont of Bathymodiolus puteoserpentis (Logatchev)]